MSHKQPLHSLVNDKNQDQNARAQTYGHTHPFKQYVLNFTLVFEDKVGILVLFIFLMEIHTH